MTDPVPILQPIPSEERQAQWFEAIKAAIAKAPPARLDLLDADGAVVYSWPLDTASAHAWRSGADVNVSVEVLKDTAFPQTDTKPVRGVVYNAAGEADKEVPVHIWPRGIGSERAVLLDALPECDGQGMVMGRLLWTMPTPA